MIVTTTTALDNKPVKEYLGLVAGETIIGANIVKDLFAAVRDVVGGRSASYEKVLKEAKEIALEEMKQQAREQGANAVIGVDLDYETMNAMLMVIATGTAVKI